jgi:hypothetical protein
MKKILGKKEIIKKYHFCPYLELISKTKTDTQEPKLCTIGLTLSIIIYHACNSKSEKWYAQFVAQKVRIRNSPVVKSVTKDLMTSSFITRSS